MKCPGNATRAYNVNMDLGVTGKGISVGIIDTGALLVSKSYLAVPSIFGPAMRGYAA